MNQRITNQPHQLRPVGSTKVATLTAETPVSLFDLYREAFPADAGIVKWQTLAAAEYRMDGVDFETGNGFVSAANEQHLTHVHDADEIILLGADNATVIIQALGE